MENIIYMVSYISKYENMPHAEVSYRGNNLIKSTNKLLSHYLKCSGTIHIVCGYTFKDNQ